MVRKILLATDGSENSRKAMEFAAEMASRYEAEIFALHVVAKRTIPQEVIEYVEAEEIEDSADSIYLDRLGERIIQKCELYVKSRCDELKTIVVRGDPAEIILEIANEKDVDTIVMGSRGLGMIRGALLGSVTRKVSSLAKCTCIIVK